MLPPVIVSHYIPLHIILYIHLISHYIPLYQIISHYLLQQYPITSHSGQIQSYPHVSWWLLVSPPQKQRTRLFPFFGVTTDLPHILVRLRMEDTEPNMAICYGAPNHQMWESGTTPVNTAMVCSDKPILVGGLEHFFFSIYTMYIYICIYIYILGIIIPSDSYFSEG